MLTYQYEIIANQKQQEIEQNAKQAWKFDVLKEAGTIQKVMKMFKITPNQVKSNPSFETCVVC
jgi:hypothetical protein